MNKKTVLVAALAGMASLGAQAQSVSLYGLGDLSVVNAKRPGSAASVTAVESGNMTTSYWGMKATESLGGGLSAEATLESFFRAQNGALGRFDGDPMFSRNANVALKGGFGTVALGRITNSLFVNNLIFNAFGDSFGFSPAIRLMHVDIYGVNKGITPGDTGWNESIKWTLPAMAGTTVSIHHAVKGNRVDSNTNVSALYFRGPISAGASWQQVGRRDGAPGSVGATDADSWQIGAAYDAKVVKVFAQIGKVENKSNRLEYDHLGFGAAVPLSAAGKLLLQYNQVEPNNSKANKITAVGYDHFLSKRTDLYTVYMNERLINGSGNTFGVGIRHRF